MVTENTGGLTSDVALWGNDGADTASSCVCGGLVNGGGSGLLLLLEASEDWERWHVCFLFFLGDVCAVDTFLSMYEEKK